MNTEILCIIPARGGSKSIPRKNLIEILDKPLISWTIEVAKASKFITRIIVSTDDDEIAQVSKFYGAEVPFIRPSKFAQDTSRDIEYHMHALNWFNKNEPSYKPFAIVNLRPTTPLREPKIIDEAISLFLENPEADSLRSVQISNENPYKMWAINNNYLKQITYIENINEPFNEPRQELPVTYWQNGYIDIVKREIIKKEKSTTGRKVLSFIIDNPSIDLDYPEEIKEAEKQLTDKFSSKKKTNNNPVK